MIGKASRIHCTIAIVALLFSSGLPAAERPEQGFADPLLGRRDLTVDGPEGTYPSWLEIRLRTEWELMAQVVGQFGSANILYDPSHFILQQLDYLQFIDIYHERIKAFHVKDAEFNPTGRAGTYGGYLDWIDRRAGFGHWATGGSTFAPCSRSSRSTITMAGLCSNGNVALSTRNRVRQKVRLLSLTT